MLNIPVDKLPQIIKSKINFSINYKNYRNVRTPETLSFEIKRYLKDNFFAIKTNFDSPLESVNSYRGVQLNNKNFATSSLLIGESSKDEIIFGIPQFKGSLFKEVNYLTVYQNRDAKTISPHFISQMKINHGINLQNYLLNNNGILFKTPRIITDKGTANYYASNKPIVSNHHSITYNNIMLLPVELKQGVHNRILYKVAVFNDSGEDISRDFAIKDAQISNLKIDGNQKLNVSFEKFKTPENYFGINLIGQLVIDDFTYFDFLEQQTKKGLDATSKRGYIVPHNYQGNLNPILNLNLNVDFEDINLSVASSFATPYLDPNNGILKLEIKDIVENGYTPKYKKYSEKDVIKIITSELSLQAIINLAKNE